MSFERDKRQATEGSHAGAPQPSGVGKTTLTERLFGQLQMRRASSAWNPPIESHARLGDGWAIQRKELGARDRLALTCRSSTTATCSARRTARRIAPMCTRPRLRA